MASDSTMCGGNEQEVLMAVRPVGIRDTKRETARVGKGLGKPEGARKPNHGGGGLDAIK
jgi:hypothetical protein